MSAASSPNIFELLAETSSAQPPEIRRGTLRLGFSVLALVAGADLLLFGRPFGISVSIFGALMAGFLAWNRPGLRWDFPRICGVFLLGGALLESAIDFNFCNLVALGALLSAAMIDQLAELAAARGAIWAMAFVSGAKAIVRWGQFLALLGRAVRRPVRADVPAGFGWVRVARIALPVVCIVLPFAWLLGRGNALLGSYLQVALNLIPGWIQVIQLPSFGRCFFWLVASIAMVAFLFPARADRIGQLCIRKWQGFDVPADLAVARWRSWLLLGTLNGLFLWANGLDAVYLWLHSQLPAGVTYSAFVHEGVAALITTTVLSAIFLAILYQQNRSITDSRPLRVLTYLWIAQNLALIASVCLRLKLYVDAYQLSTARLQVGNFLILTVAGYSLLTWRIAFNRSLNWLVQANCLAVFALFYGLQFVDDGQFVAHYNTSRWLESRTHRLDMGYLESLGPSSWPSLLAISRSAPKTFEGHLAEVNLRIQVVDWDTRALARPWQSWQWRPLQLREQMLSTLPKGVRLWP